MTEGGGPVTGGGGAVGVGTFGGTTMRGGGIGATNASSAGTWRSDPVSFVTEGGAGYGWPNTGSGRSAVPGGVSGGVRRRRRGREVGLTNGWNQ